MDGHIWLESEGIGKGSTVTFVVKLGVPISRVEAAATSASPSLRNRTDFAGVKVLVTDDNRCGTGLARDSFCRIEFSLFQVDSF
jgi:ethylene receptor